MHLYNLLHILYPIGLNIVLVLLTLFIIVYTDFFLSVF